MLTFKHISKYLSFFLLWIPLSACAKLQCNNTNLHDTLICLQDENSRLKNHLNKMGNQNKLDYKNWEKKIKEKCEGQTSYAAGEGLGVQKESCYYYQYIERLEYLKTGKKIVVPEKNIYGLGLSTLPYNSNDHDKCFLTPKKNNCEKLNLIKTTQLIKYYEFISPSFGDGVILPISNDGKEIIISLSEDGGGPQIIISTIDKFGVVKQKTLYIHKNVIIDEDYILHYWDGKKQIKEKL